jgi:hypothetical protein
MTHRHCCELISSKVFLVILVVVQTEAGDYIKEQINTYTILYLTFNGICNIFLAAPSGTNKNKLVMIMVFVKSVALGYMFSSCSYDAQWESHREHVNIKSQ